MESDNNEPRKRPKDFAGVYAILIFTDSNKPEETITVAPGNFALGLSAGLEGLDEEERRSEVELLFKTLHHARHIADHGPPPKKVN